MCAANCGETFSREIDFNDVKDQQFCLLSRPDLMRFQKYFVCSSCESNIDVDEEIEASILVDIEEVHDGNKIRFKPHSIREDDQNEEDIVTQAEPNDVNIQDTRMVTVFFPNSRGSEFKERAGPQNLYVERSPTGIYFVTPRGSMAMMVRSINKGRGSRSWS